MLNSLLNWAKTRDSTKSEFSKLAPDVGFYAVGDIHGRADLLEQILTDLPNDLPLIFVGDYVDRGDESAKVLNILQSRNDFVCLKGNHEDMLLQFVDDPARYGSRWLRFGGLQTLASYRIGGINEHSSASELESAAEEFSQAIGENTLQWLRNLPTMHVDGNIAVVHAGADPSKSLDQQSERTLLWGHEEFERVKRSDGMWVVHGHTIVDAACAQNGRISIDTGAYVTGKLSACRVSDDLVLFDHTR